jgi:hypothetical protein
METLTSAAAAEQLGVTPQKFHRLVAKHNVSPVLAAPGVRGAKFWFVHDIERIADAEAETP